MQCVANAPPLTRCGPCNVFVQPDMARSMNSLRETHKTVTLQAFRDMWLVVGHPDVRSELAAPLSLKRVRKFFETYFMITGVCVCV